VNQGRAKGNHQQSRVQKSGRKARETRPERRRKPRKRERRRGTGKAAVRRNREEKERKNRRLSSWKRKTNGRKKGSRKRKIPKGKRTRGSKTEGKHLWNGCGSEAGKSERKRTAKLSTGIRKEGMRNQAGEKGEAVEVRTETGTGKATVRQGREEMERKNRG
jgi:hypothetical protein